MLPGVTMPRSLLSGEVVNLRARETDTDELDSLREQCEALAEEVADLQAEVAAQRSAAKRAMEFAATVKATPLAVTVTPAAPDPRVGELQIAVSALNGRLADLGDAVASIGASIAMAKPEVAPAPPPTPAPAKIDMQAIIDTIRAEMKRASPGAPELAALRVEVAERDANNAIKSFIIQGVKS
jgi:hypothetical protein